MPKLQTVKALETPTKESPKSTSDWGFKPSNETALKTSNILVHGPPGVGKTFLSLTASDQWPAELPPKKHVVLTDIAHFAFDSQAVLAAGTTELTFFQRTLTDGRELTNMKAAGFFASPERMQI